MPSSSAKPRPTDHLRLVVPSAAGGASLAAGAGPAGAMPAGSLSAKGVAGAKPAAAAAQSIGDWAWHGLGVGVAAASAGFATYAMVFSTGEVVPSGNFNLFGRYDRPYQAASAQHTAPAARAKAAGGRAARPGGTEVAAADAVDFEPTGSVAPPQGAAQATDAAARRGADGPALPGFRLRDVFDGKALVESRSSLSVVKPGSVIDGAGEVLSIEKRGEHWIVLTQNGVIAGQRR